VSIDQVIALAASVGAFASAIATLLTVREMRRQQQLAFLPEIFLSAPSHQYGVALDFHGQFQTPFRWVLVNDSWSEERDKLLDLAIQDLSNDKRHEGEYEYHLNITNVGRGIAKKIAIQWDYPFEQVERELQAWVASFPQYQQSYVRFTSDPKYLNAGDDGEFGIMGGPLGLNGAGWKKLLNIEYLLPHQDLRSQTQIVVPKAVILVLLVRAWILHKNGSEFRALAPQFRPLLAMVTWSDDTGLSHSVRYELIPYANYQSHYQSKKRILDYAILNFTFNRIEGGV
jgi:hypothetical protein